MDENKVTKRRMVFKILRLWFWSATRLRWYLPGTPEISTNELKKRLDSDDPPILVDLRDQREFDGNGKHKYEQYGHIPTSRLIPFFKLSSRLAEIPQNKEIITICPGGGMSLTGVDILINAGFNDVKSLKGGIKDWDRKGYKLNKKIAGETSENEGLDANLEEERDEFILENQTLNEKDMSNVSRTLDARNLSCPGPVLKAKKALMELEIGQVLEVLATDPASRKDIPSWAVITNQELVISEDLGSKGYRFLVKRKK